MYFSPSPAENGLIVASFTSALVVIYSSIHKGSCWVYFLSHLHKKWSSGCILHVRMDRDLVNHSSGIIFNIFLSEFPPAIYSEKLKVFLMPKKIVVESRCFGHFTRETDEELSRRIRRVQYFSYEGTLFSCQVRMHVKRIVNIFSEPSGSLRGRVLSCPTPVPPPPIIIEN